MLQGSDLHGNQTLVPGPIRPCNINIYIYIYNSEQFPLTYKREIIIPTIMKFLGELNKVISMSLNIIFS